MLSTFARGALCALFFVAVFPLSAAAVGVQGPLVDSSWLKANLGAKGLVVIDVRGGPTAAADFAAAHVPGAVHAPYEGAWRTERDGVPGMLPEISEIESYIRRLGISNSSTIVIVPAGVGASEFGVAARIYWTLKYLGHDGVAILDGGWNAWLSDASNSTAAGASEVAEGDFVATPRPELLASTSDVAGKLETDVLLVDARPREQYAGATKHPAADRAGHIPGALNVDQAQFYDPAANRLRPKDEIASMVSGNLKQDASEIISYCNTGHWAATNWFVMSEVLGLENVRLYDASMVGWSRNSSLPVETLLAQ